MKRKIKKWAFVTPKLSRDMSEYFAGVLDFIKSRPEIFLYNYTFADRDLSALAKMDGIISYSMPTAEVLKVFEDAGVTRPPTVVITMKQPTDPSFAYATIDADGVAERVFDLLRRRHCRSFGFCASHSAYLAEESATLQAAFEKTVFAKMGTPPAVFTPNATLDPNLIPEEIERFAEWFKARERPCGVFVHTDDVARKMLDSCRLKGIRVPNDLRVVGTGNSATYCERTTPTLTSYAIDHVRAGYATAEALYKLVNRKATPAEASFALPLAEVFERASTADERGSARLTEGARAYIREQIDAGKSPTGQQIAYILNVSRRKLEIDFQNVTGHTLHDEIASYRLKKLRDALKSSNESLHMLARRAGFSTFTYAARAFRTKMGMTMSEYRKRG